VQRLHGREMGGLGESFNAMAGELESKVADLQDSRSRIVTSEESVRRAIAEHLHGPVQARLLGMRVQLNGIAANPQLPPAEAVALRGVMDELLEVAEKEVAVKSRELWPTIITRGIVPSVQSLADRHENSLDIQIKVDASLYEREKRNVNFLPEETRMAAYRITNEALGNVLKHAPGAGVVIELAWPEEGWLDLRIKDDGPGFDTSRESNGLGLRTMLDYSGAVGGSCSVESSPGRGTVISARLPTGAGRDAKAGAPPSN
jgi:signal transduction histidine kinase